MNTPTKVGIGLIGLVLICGGTPLFFYAKSDIPQAAARMNENLTKAQKAGLWTRRDDLIASYKVPENENAAPILTKLLVKTSKVLKPDTSYWKDGQLDELATLNAWNQLEDDLKLIDESESKPHCKFPRDLRLLPATRFPEYAKLKAVWKLLAARSKIAIPRNDLATAKLCWRRMTVVAQHLRDENVLLTDLVRIGLSMSLCNSLQTALNQRGRQAEWLAAIEEILTRIDQPHDVRAALSSELIYAFDMVYLFHRNPKVALSMMGSGEDPPPNSLKTMRHIPGIQQASFSRIAEAYGQAALKLDPAQRDSRNIRSVTERLDKAFKQEGTSWKIPSYIVPIFAQWGEAVAKDSAHLAVLKQSVRVIRGDKPDLTATPDFDLKPLRTKQTDQGLVVYSIGNNRTDDGGDLSPAKPGSQYTKDFGVLIPK